MEHGIVNRVTKEGIIGEDFTVLSGSVDTFGETNVQLDKNMQLNENTALRVNGENLNNRRDFYYGDAFGVNPTLMYDLGDGSSLSVSYEYLDQERFLDQVFLQQTENLLKRTKTLCSVIPPKISPHMRHIFFMQSMNTRSLIH